MISTPATRAAFALLTSCPVHLHRCDDPPPSVKRKPTQKEAMRRRELIAQLVREGNKKRWIPDLMLQRFRIRISRTAVQKHLRAIAGGRYGKASEQ